ncbi:DUF4352 domain-containing protein [Geodermatophilus sp. SYSU D00705]
MLALLLGLAVVSNAVDGSRDSTDDAIARDIPALGTDAAIAGDGPALGTGGVKDGPTLGAEGDVVPPQAAPDPATPGLGEPAADGDFRFVVTGVECGATTLGGSYLNTTAQGQFCIVDLSVTNIGDEAHGFSGSDAILLNDQGQEFSADPSASIYLEDSSSLYEEINPGNTLNSRVVFDVPPGMAPTAIELHDSMFSGGVTVLLQ